MNVLITGSTGYLGKHLLPVLIKNKFNVFESNTKIANLTSITNLHCYNNIQMDYIIHLAAKTKAGDWCKFHKGEQWIDNQILNTNILNYWCRFQPKAKLICAGTSCSYGPSNKSMKEEQYTINEPNIDLYTYAMTKRMLLTGCQSLAHQYGLKYNYLIPSTLYGPNFSLDDSHFIFDLIKKIVSGKYENTAVELWGGGLQRRELVFIDDVVEIILHTLLVENQIINIGYGKDYTIKQFAKKISTYIGYDYDNIKYDTSKFVGVRKKLLNIDKLKSILPKNFQFTHIDTGLKRTIDYYIEYYENNKITV